MWQKIKKYIDNKIVRPFRDSKKPTSEIAKGAMIGMFWAMTPLVGIQMTLVTINWVLFRIFKIRFSIPIAMAMVWLSNPITMGPLYYMFYMIGFLTFHFLGSSSLQISYDTFTNKLSESLSMGAIDGSIDFITYIFVDMGWPMLIGGFVIAIPLSIMAYFLAIKFVTKHRMHLAKKEGITFEEWEHRHLKSHPVPLSLNQPTDG